MLWKVYSTRGFVTDVDAITDFYGSLGVHSNINDNSKEKEYGIRIDTILA